jgi:hypothetical protein
MAITDWQPIIPNQEDECRHRIDINLNSLITKLPRTSSSIVIHMRRNQVVLVCMGDDSPYLSRPM